MIYKNLDNYINKFVYVYYNLHKHCFSVKYKNRVVGYGNYILLNDVKFIVRESGRKMVLQKKRKNVHAFVSGILKDYDINSRMINNLPIITYNPYKYDTFVYKMDETPIFNLKSVILNNNNNKIYDNL